MNLSSTRVCMYLSLTRTGIYIRHNYDSILHQIINTDNIIDNRTTHEVGHHHYYPFEDLRRCSFVVHLSIFQENVLDTISVNIYLLVQKYL